MRSRKHFPDRAGFTLIEILLVISLAAVAAGFGVVFGLDAYQRSTFRGQQDILVSALQKARSRALANIGQCHHVLEVWDSRDGYTLKAEDRTDDSVQPCEAVADETFELGSTIQFQSAIEPVVFLPVSADIEGLTADEEAVFILEDINRDATAYIRVGAHGSISWE